MSQSYHAYRPILPPTLLQEMVDDLGERDPFTMTDYYRRFLEDSEGLPDFDLPWVMTELLWNKYQTKPIRISTKEAGRLQKIAELYPGDVPPLTIGKNAFCYEFPVNPPIYPLEKPHELTSMLIATGEEIGIVWQFVGDITIATILSPGKLVATLNDEHQKGHESEQPGGFWIAQRRRLLLAYRLCNGLLSIG